MSDKSLCLVLVLARLIKCNCKTNTKTEWGRQEQKQYWACNTKTVFVSARSRPKVRLGYQDKDSCNKSHKRI